MQALGVYCYAGGFTLGIRESFNVSCHLEDPKPYAEQTARHNLGPIDIIPETGSELHNWWKDESHLHAEYLGAPAAWRDDYDLIYGNPPCAAWSQAGRRGERWRTDPRVHCTTKHLSLVERHRPRFWVWETIQATWNRGRSFVDDVASELARQGYHVTALLHNAKWIDGVQDRRRLFVCASRHAPFRPERPDQLERKLLWDAANALRALNDLGVPYEGPETKHTYLWKDTPDGKKLCDTFDRLYLDNSLKDERGKKFTGIGSVSGRPGFQLRRLPSTGPAPTVVVPMMHWSKERWLTEREMSEICGFPSSWAWCRGRKLTGAIINEMARGVSPKVAAWLGQEIAEHLKGAPSQQPPSYRVFDMLEQNTVETILSC